MGARYEVGAFVPQLLYEMRKDVLGYLVFIGLFSLIDHLLRRPGETPAKPSTFDIRDGAKLTRVRLEEISGCLLGRQLCGIPARRTGGAF